MSLTGLYPASYLQGSCHRPCPSSHTLVVWFLHIFPDVAPPGITPSWKSSLKPSWTWHPLWLPESHHLHPRVSRPCPLHLETCLPPPILGLGAGAWAETSSRKSGQEVFPGRGRLGAKSGGREGMAGRDQCGWSSEAQRLRQTRARLEHGGEIEVGQDTLGSVELIPRTGILRNKAWTRRCSPLWVFILLKLWHRRMAKGPSLPSLTPWPVHLLSTGAVMRTTAAIHMPRTPAAIPSCSPTPGIVSIRVSSVVSSQHNTQQQPLAGT